MQTYLQLVNSVLLRLREASVSTAQGSGTTNQYARLIGQFINEAKAQVEQAYDWGVLRTNTAVNTTASVASYNITGTNNSTRVFDVFDDTNDNRLEQRPREWFNDKTYLETTDSGMPHYFCFDGIDTATGELKIKLYPTPDATYTIRVDHKTIQPDLSLDTDELKVPARPVVLLAWAMAIEERGEDAGQQSTNAYRSGLSALADEIAYEANRSPETIEWYQN